MKMNSITDEKFQETKRGRKSGYRTEVLNEIKKAAANPKNKGLKFEIPLEEEISVSTWQYLRKTLVNVEKVIKEMGYVPNKENTKKIKTVTFACN